MFKRVIKEEIKVPADIDHLGEMRDFITRVGRKYGIPERSINAFKLAIDEAGTNIIKHAYRDWDGLITIRIFVRDKSATVCLIDQGHAFDPRKVKDPDLQRYVDIGKKGGLGIFIIRRVIDTIDYRKTPEGNELRLTKVQDLAQKKKLAVLDVSFTMKTRFSLIASGILTAVAVIGFFWNYFLLDNRILARHLQTGESLVKSLASSALEDLDGDETLALTTLAHSFLNDNRSLLAEVVIVDTAGKIHGSGANPTGLLLQDFSIPENAVRKSDNITRYHLPNGKNIFDITERAILTFQGRDRWVGNVHVMLDKAIIDHEINVARRQAFMLFLTVLLLGYIGIFVLVYFTMSPFKKLATWVRMLGKEESQEEMDFDTSDEIGEIAKAFNEITTKFRKSQENLAEQERLQKEMQVAQEIQHTLLPSSFPDIEGYEIASYYEAAKEVGGDYFDFVEVDKDTLGIVVADVSGKGVPGSLVMTMIRTALRTEARGNKNAADVLARVNDFVMNDMKRGMFVTIFYIILDSKNRIISYASAGHNPMILFRVRTSKSYYLNPRGFPVGINLPDNTLFRQSIQSDTLRLKDGDVLIIYTDGITEAMNTHRDRFGDERLLSVLRRFGDLQVDPLVEKIKNEVNEFTGGYAQSDDITLVAIREKMRAEDVLFNIRSRLMHMVNEEGMSVKEACRVAGVSSSTYYKYKKRFDKMGVNGLKEKVQWSEVEEKHISIEDRAKIYDIIQKNPDYGPKRISEILNTEEYGITVIDERRIYDELVRSRLNTKPMRIAFVERGGRKKRIKPPGTPFLTLDGDIIIESKERLPLVKEPSKEEGGKPPFGMHVSQKTAAEPVEEQAEEGSVLDEFLGLKTSEEEREVIELRPLDKEDMESPGVMMDVRTGKQGEGKADQTDKDFSGSKKSEGEDQDILDGMEAEFTEDEMSVPGKAGVEDVESAGSFKDHPEKAEESDAMDLGFDDMMADLVSEVDEEAVQNGDETESGETVSLDEILGMDSGSDDKMQKDEVENNITESTLGELFDEEMGVIGFPESGTAEEKEGRETESDEYEEVLKEQKESESYEIEKTLALRFFESGLQYYQQADYEQAVEEFEKALVENPTFIKGYQCLGDAYFRMGKLDEARKAYERVKELDPDNINVLENLGVIFANRGDYKKAVWQWGEVLKRNPERKDIIDRIKKMQRVIRQRYL